MYLKAWDQRDHNGLIIREADSQDIDFFAFKVRHISFLLKSWEEVLRAAHLMSMNRVSIAMGPTRHGVMRGTTIYAFDLSGKHFASPWQASAAF